MKASHILGINARTVLFTYPYNTRKGKATANSKLLSARALGKLGVPTPKIYKKFFLPKDIMTFDWTSLPAAFALKPSRGLGGDGIIVVKKRSPEGDGWVTTQKTKVTVDDLKMHVLDILEGAYSMGNVPDSAFIQEYVGRHKRFQKYAYRGTPDIRIIVFHNVPTLAMLRLPTKESGGRANLHQGAIGVGVDIATGITTRAIWHAEPIRVKPGTSRKLNGIKIPHWNEILLTAAQCQNIPGLGYMGVDIVLHPERGPMVLEVNAQPGLQIQLANMIPLKRRLERLEGLEVKDAEHGVKIAKVLFAERFSDRVKAHEGVKTLKPIEPVTIYAPGKKHRVVTARIDTGAVRSSIDRELAEELGLLTEENILWKRKYAYRSASGKQSRPVIALHIKIAGRTIKTSASVANRHRLSTPLLIGRNDLSGFVISAEEHHTQGAS